MLRARHLMLRVVVALVAALTSGAAAAQSWSFRTAVKGSLLASHAPDDPALFPDRDAAVSFWRVRLEPTATIGDDVTITAAYEQRLRVFNTSPGLSGGGVLPGDVDGPFRVRQLDWSLASSDGLVWRHEIDRAALVWTLPSDATFTVGRQAIGWGRGVMFGAIDLFAPFSPLEADREWRRGIDAARLEVPLSPRSSIDAVAAFGPSVDESAFAARVRGYVANVDVEVVGGRRARDPFGGVTSSAAIGDAEVHGEAALFRARDGDVSRGVAKIVAGGSYQFAIGPGVLAFFEYHYSGFGVAAAEDLLPRLSDPAFVTRVLRGDTQILGRHALAATASSELSPEWTLGAQWVHNPTDGSGVVAPSIVYSIGDSTSMLMNVYAPYGRPPAGGVLKSEYGVQGVGLFLQLRIYR